MTTLKEKYGIRRSTAALFVIAALYLTISTFARADEAVDSDRAPAAEQKTERIEAPKSSDEHAVENSDRDRSESAPSDSAI